MTTFQKHHEEQAFLSELQSKAKLQSRLTNSHILPSQLDGFTAFIGNYPWQSLLGISFVSAILWSIIVWR